MGGAGFDLERYERERAKAPTSRAPVASGVSAPRASGRKVEWVGSSTGGGDAPSFGKQLLDVIPATAKGVFTGLIPGIWDETVGNIGGAAQNIALRRSADDIRTGDGVGGALGRLFANESMVESVEQGRPLLDQFRAASPIVGGTVEGIGRAAHDAAEMAVEVPFTDKGFKDTALKKASDEGETANYLLETLGSALFGTRLASGAAATAALRAGANAPRLAKFAQAARRADDAVDRAVLAPITLPVKGAAAGVRKFANSERGQTMAKSRVGQAAKVRTLLPSTAPLRDAKFKYDDINAIRREEEALSPGKRVKEVLSGADDGLRGKKLRPPEIVKVAEGAMTLGIRDMRHLLPLDQLRKASPDAFGAVIRQIADEYDNPSWTPEAVGMYFDKLNGSLDPELSTAIDRAAAEWTDRAVKGGMEREVDGTRVVSGAEPNFVAGTGRLFDTPEGPAQRAESLTARERIFDNVEPESPMSVPARFRDNIVMARAIDDALGKIGDEGGFDLPDGLLANVRSQIPTTVDGVLSSTNPTFMRSGRLPDSQGGSGGGARAKGIAAEYAKQGGNVPLDIDTQSALAANDIRRQTTNQMLGEVQRLYGFDLSARPEFEGLKGRELVKAVSDEMGEEYVAWNPARLFDQDFASSGIEKGETLKITKSETPAGAQMVPKWVADSFDYAYKQQGALADAYDWLMRGFKAAVLPLNSPRWLAGNAISGSLMAHAGEVSPVDLVKYFDRGRQAMRDYAQGRASEVPREVMGTGHSASERRLFDDVAASLDEVAPEDMMTTAGGKRSGRRLTAPVTWAVRKGYDANTWTDDLYRNIVYLKKVDEGASVGEGVKEARAILGNFERLTPFERRVMRRVFPFYAWTKHVTKLSTKLATEDPARVAWNMALPLIFAPEDQDFEGPSWLQAMANVGDDKFMSLGWAFPFSVAGEFDPSNPQEFVASQLSPVIGTAYSLATGNDPSFGRFEAMSSPDTPYGQSPGFLPFSNPLGAAHVVASNLPQYQAIYDELQRRRSEGKGQRLFDTGERMGKEDPNKDLARNLGRLFGVPMPKEYNAG